MLKKLKIYYLFVSLPFVMLLVGAAIFIDGIKYTIATNPHPQINYTIFTIILVGGVIILFNARRLMREAIILVDFSRALHAKTDAATLKDSANNYVGDIACLAQMVATSGDRAISHQEQVALEHELSNVRSRLNRRNALPQYLTGLLVGMGLLGTFIGLLATLNDITILITSFADLDMANVNPIDVFSTMITRMKAPMQSMAIAFSASMFGLLGSIILGLMMVGLRRLQGDILSVLSSEIARHVEIALSFESVSFRSGEEVQGDAASANFSTEILLRIEERLAETARLRQRALSSEIDDFKKQRGDMLHALTEQTEANNNFRSELQQLTGQLGTIFNSMGKGNGEISSQVSELTVHMAGDAKETHKLLAMQVDEQKKLIDTIDSYKIEERLAEAARLQQRALSSEIDDFKNQRSDMLLALTEQTEASNNFHTELQQLGRQLSTAFDVMDKGNNEISAQLSELTVHMGTDAKQSHILLNKASNNFRTELQQLGGQLENQLGAISNVMEKGNDELTNQISELTTHMDGDSEKSLEQRADILHKLAEQIETSNTSRSELQQTGSQLESQLITISDIVDKSNSTLANQISELTAHASGEAKQSQEQRDTMLRTLTEQIEASNSLRTELQQIGNQLGSQLGTISNVSEKGSNDLVNQISELRDRLAADAKETHKLLAPEMDEQVK